MDESPGSISNGSSYDKNQPLPCLTCGYDLRGQWYEGVERIRCPECGDVEKLEIILRFHIAPINHTSNLWVQALFRNPLLILAACVPMAIAFAWIGVVSMKAWILLTFLMGSGIAITINTKLVHQIKTGQVKQLRWPWVPTIDRWLIHAALILIQFALLFMLLRAGWALLSFLY